MSGSQHMDGMGRSIPKSRDGYTAPAVSSESNGNSGKSSSSESADSEEQEDSSSSSSSSALTSDNKNNIELKLSSFRRKWKKELKISKVNGKENKPVKEQELRDYNGPCEVETREITIEEEARKWYLQGVENEKSGKLYEAILSYKKAVQLVPDIEFRLCEPQRQKNIEESSTLAESSEEEIRNSNQKEMEEGEEEEEEEGGGGGGRGGGGGGEEEEEEVELIMKLQRLFSGLKAICEPENEQKTTHISALPVEIILYIFRWVVSHDLDLRSLEMCSMVCRGFYVCSRDPEIWRIACLKIWGVTCGGLSNFNNWRMMYLSRPHLNFNGCYISKTTYIRPGENSFQDQFYRPWHIVEYFRYLRFFPEGTVLMLTTPEQPAPVLYLLKKREARNPSVLCGHYRLLDDKVTVVLHRQDLISNNRFRGRRGNHANDMVEQTFHIELQVVTFKNRRSNQLNNQLLWRKYAVMSKRGNTDTKTTFDVSSNKFSPFWFSRVKSYTAESDGPL